MGCSKRVDTRPGFFHLAGVVDGTYTLTETTAPDGYTRLEHPIRFSVRDGQVFWPEGLPVIDSTAWIANTRTGTPPNPTVCGASRRRLSRAGMVR